MIGDQSWCSAGMVVCGVAGSLGVRLSYSSDSLSRLPEAMAYYIAGRLLSCLASSWLGRRLPFVLRRRRGCPSLFPSAREIPPFFCPRRATEQKVLYGYTALSRSRYNSLDGRSLHDRHSNVLPSHEVPLVWRHHNLI